MEPTFIRIRACLAVVENGRILLVPHYATDAGAVQWNLPGGKVEYGEGLQQCALRELFEETGATASITGLLDVSEVILPERPWHSVTIAYLGVLTGGVIRAEADHPYGEKHPRWFSAGELAQEKYHPAAAIDKALSPYPVIGK